MASIVEGCKAIVVGNHCVENIGKIVTVGRFIGRISGFICTDIWEVNQPMKCTDGEYRNVSKERYLQRIDNEDETEEITKGLEVDA